MQVFLRENNVAEALGVLKHKLQKEDVFRNMRQARTLRSPTSKRAREKAEAIRRAKKLARK